MRRNEKRRKGATQREAQEEYLPATEQNNGPLHLASFSPYLIRQKV